MLLRIGLISMAGAHSRENVDAEVHLAAVLAQQTLGQRQDVRRAFAQRPPGQREDRQAIVEVLAETPRRDFRREVAVGRGKHADIQVDRFARTDPLHLALLQYAQQLGLQARGISDISSRRMVPPSASSNLPGWAAMAPVKEPFSWPNRVASSMLSGIAAQLIAMNGLPARGDCWWI